MKRFTMKRITALALALIMTLSLCPVTAFAAMGEDDKHVCDDPDSYCLVCDVADKINALPEVVSVDNAADVTEQIHAIDRIKVDLTEDQYEEMLTLVDTRPNSTGFGGLDEPTRYMETLVALANLDAGGSLYISKKYSVGDAELDWTKSDASFSLECIDEDSSFSTLNVTLEENEESYLAALDDSFYSADADGWTNRYILPAGTYRITETGYHAVTTDGEELITTPSYVVNGNTTLDSAVVVVEEGKAVSVLAYNGFSHYHSFCGDNACTDDNHIVNGAWEAITSEDELLAMQDGRSYFLASPITVSSTVNISGTVNLCLNGNELALAEDASGSVILVGENAVLNLCDCQNSPDAQITGGNGTPVIAGSEETVGGGVYVYFDGTFNMYGGTISGNTATNGGGVCTEMDSSFTMYGGYITENEVAAVPLSGIPGGGGVYVDSYSTFTMEDGTISGNNAGSGGGVYVNANSTFTMNGGTVSGNTATSGGGVDNAGTFTMTGGTISGNEATNDGGGISSNGPVGSGNPPTDGIITMTGGTITGNNAAEYGGGVFVGQFGAFNVSGTPVITDNVKNGTLNNVSGLYEQGTDNNVYLSGDSNPYPIYRKVITVDGALGVDAEIGITPEVVPTIAAPVKVVEPEATYTLTEQDKAQFVSDNTAYEVVDDGYGNLNMVFAHAGHYNCGVVGCTADHGHSDVSTWTKLTKADLVDGKLTLTDGNSYYLGEDIAVSSAVITTGAVNLCLNGNTLSNASGDALQVCYGDSLVVCDCSDNNAGKINGSQRGIYCENVTALTVYGGTVSGETGIYVGSGSNNATVTINGGVVSGADTGIYLAGTTSKATINAGTVSGKKGIEVLLGDRSIEVSVTGGTITGTSGSAVSVECKTTISGGTISGTSTTGNAYGISAGSNDIYLSGSPNISGTTGGIKLDGKQIIVNGALSNVTPIGITMTTAGVFAKPDGTNVTDLSSYAEKFTSDNTAYEVAVDGVNLKLELTHSHPTCGVVGCTADHGHSEVSTWTKLTKADLTGESPTLSDGNYYLGEDITVTSTVNISGAVNLCLNGKTLKNESGDAIVISTNANLVVCDCSGSNAGTISGKRTIGSTSKGISCETSASLTVNSGTVSGNDIGIYADAQASSVTITVNGGVVTGNNGRYGIGLLGATSTVTVNGGTISAPCGICSRDNASSSEIYVTGGTITGTLSEAIFTICQAEISGGILTGNMYGIQAKTNGISLSGAPAISGTTGDIKLDGVKIKITDDLTNTTPIGVTMTSAGEFTSGWTTYMDGDTPTDYFSSDNAAYEVVKAGNELKLVAKVIDVSSVTLNKSSTTIAVGGTEQLTATVEPNNATNKTVTWSSDDENIATVDSDGKVTAKTVGTATITASAGGKSATCTVTVYQTYPLWVGGVPFTSNNLVIDSTDISGVTGNATYDPATKTLTLNGFSLNYSGENAAINVESPLSSALLTINLVGDNTVTNTSTIQPALSVPKLNITGSGKLTAQGGLFGISGAEITISSGTVTAISTSNNYGIHTGNYVIIEGGEVTAKGGVAGISSRTVIIKGGTVTADSMQDGIGAAEFGSSTTYEVGVFIEGGTVTATGGQKGINAASISVSGGTVTAKGNNCAMNTAPSFDSSTFAATASTASDGNPMGAYVAADLAVYKYIKIEPHTHSYTYSGSGSVITESCTCYHSETATIAAPAGSLIYNGSAKEATVSYSDGWIAARNLTVSYDSHGNINVGTVTASITKDGETATATYTITAKQLTNPTLTLSQDSFTYDGAEKKPTVSVMDGSTTLTEDTDYTITWPADCANVGSKTITVTFKGNYSGNKTAEYVIVEADSSCEPPVAINDLVYTGSAQNLVNAATPTGGTVQYSLSATGTFSDSIPTGTNAGTYTVYYKVIGDANHNDTAVLGPVQVKIAKQKVTMPAENTATFTYNGTAHTYMETTSTLYEISNETQTNAGSYTVIVALKNTANYEWADGTTSTLTFPFSIGKATLTVKAKDHTITYGDAPANNGVEYSGFVNSETPNVLGGALEYAYSYTQYGDVGSAYTITPSGLTSGNYNITFSTGKLTVEKKEIGINWGNTALTYTGAALVPTAIATGKESTDVIELTVDGAQTNVGSYTATVTGITGEKAGNYTLPSTKTTTFTIGKAESSATAPVAVDNLVYTGSAQNLVTAATPTGGTVQYSLSATGTFADSIPTGTDAGTYNVYYKVIGDANHNDTAVLGPVQVTIVKAAQAAPTNVGKTDESVNNKNDGTITGVDSTMEYRKDGETTYKAIVGDKVENLSDGKYFVRYKEVANYNASPDAEVTIAAGRVVHNGGYPGGYYPIVPPDETPEVDPVVKPEVKPEATPTTPPAEEVVTPEPEDTTPEVVPDPPADDGAVDGTPGGDVPEEDESSAGVWIAISLVALVAIILLLIILIVRKKRKDEQK